MAVTSTLQAKCDLLVLTKSSGADTSRLTIDSSDEICFLFEGNVVICI